MKDPAQIILKIAVIVLIGHSIYTDYQLSQKLNIPYDGCYIATQSNLVIPWNNNGITSYNASALYYVCPNK